MAALRFEASADNKSAITRLGHRCLSVRAHSWRTFVNVRVERDGSVSIRVERDGALVHTYDLEAEESE